MAAISSRGRWVNSLIVSPQAFDRWQLSQWQSASSFTIVSPQAFDRWQLSQWQSASSFMMTNIYPLCHFHGLRHSPDKIFWLGDWAYAIRYLKCPYWHSQRNQSAYQRDSVIWYQPQRHLYLRRSLRRYPSIRRYPIEAKQRINVFKISPIIDSDEDRTPHWTVPCQCLNQWWLIVVWALGVKFNWNLNKQIHTKKWEMTSVKWPSFCLSLNDPL